MALSMEERRLLAEIEHRLSEEDPRLAHRLSTLGQDRRRRRLQLLAAVILAATGALVALLGAIVVTFS
ncbi:DUF3040 domain-containing protein [Actinomadura kijaniata]|uniref:DUF3040 domain-containing protein n=1 Tax=Actinomadura kijaniata TaxID=46161 RepID=UPI0008310506|nr:DUF3040 domain-containing protein [Actinomadura kijaniata]